MRFSKLDFCHYLLSSPLNDTQCIYAGEPRLYQADCRSPGSSRIMGVEGSDAKTLPMKILAYHSFEDELFGYDYPKWLEALSIHNDNIVSSILLKTQSLSNFANLWLILTQQGTGLSLGTTPARLKKVSSRKNGSDYSTVICFGENEDPAFHPRETAAEVFQSCPQDFSRCEKPI